MLPELDQPRLFGMQFQAELGQPISKLAEKTFGFCPAFKAHDQIVGVADDYYLAHGHFLAPPHFRRADLALGRRNRQ